MVQRIRSGKQKKEIDIISTSLPASNIEKIKNIVFDSIMKFDREDLNDLTENIFKKLNEVIGGQWNCILFKECISAYCVPDSECRIDFNIGDFKFVLYKLTD